MVYSWNDEPVDNEEGDMLPVLNIQFSKMVGHTGAIRICVQIMFTVFLCLHVFHVFNIG